MSIVPLRIRQPGTPSLTPNRSPWGCSKLPLTSRFAAAGAGGRGAESGSTWSVAVAEPNAPLALMRTEAGAATGKVTIGNVMVLAPGSTVTAAGTTAAAGLLLVRLTVTPPAPGTPWVGCVRISSPSASSPPGTGLGKRTSGVAGGVASGSTCSVAEMVPNWQPALIVTAVVAATGNVVIGNVAVSAPAGTVTTAGTTAAAGLLLVRVM